VTIKIVPSLRSYIPIVLGGIVRESARRRNSEVGTGLVCSPKTGPVEEGEAGANIGELCRRHEISKESCYRWRAKYE